MITEDYFLRMINQLAYVIASVLKLMKLKRYGDALEEVQVSSKQLLGMDLRLLTTLTDTEFARLLSLGERFDVEKCVVVAELLRMVADIGEAEEREEDAYRARITSLHLFLELLNQESGALPKEYHSEVQELIRRLSEFGLTQSTKEKVFRYYELAGRFDKAEDVLFELAEEDASYVESGTKFYERLLMKSDQDLENGNLPRVELNKSMMDLRKLAGRGEL